MITKPLLMFCSLGRRLLIATVLAWSVFTTSLWGATLNVPGDFSTIQAAHDAASSGDTILVAPGTYFGQITITKAITLASHFLPTGDESFIGTTILDGSGGSNVIRIPTGAEDRPTIQGFTIQNGTDGILPNAMFNLLNCLVRDTRDGVDYENDSGGLVQFCTFELNSDDGIDLDGRVDIVIADNIIRNNNDDGIEIRMQSFSGPTKNYIITRNEIYGNGEDGIQLIHYDVLTDRFFEITYNYIYNNVDAGIGMMDGSITTEDFRAADIPETIYIFNNTFSNNSHGITGGDNTVLLNNIFVDHPVIAVKNVDANSELAYNLFFNNGTDNSGSNVDVGNTIYADPLLAASLELQPGSPAIDAGTPFYIWQGTTVLNLPPGAYSGAAPDMGAFEWLDVTPPDTLPPSQPQNLTSPAQTDTTIDLLWDGSTDNVGVSFYNIYRDGALIASESSTNHTAVGLIPGTSYDFQVSAGDAAGNESAPSDLLSVMTQSVADLVTISVQVSAGEDDAEERLSSGSVSLGSSDLELIQDGSRSQAVGIRFQNVAVPPGSVIQQAYIQFTVDQTDSGPTSLEIRAQADDDPGAFIRSSGNITSRPTTAQVVNWTPPAWNTVGTSGLDQRTPDLSDVVQEIVDRIGWAEGNAMAFIITGSGERTAEAFNGDASAAPILTITYRR